MTDRSGPTSEELAAILAAVEMAWPRPMVAGAGEGDPPRWRFSGRWWTRPIPARRERPW
ncbi:MAG TPA: hypothetical protein VFA94_01630 [Acidimicrobiales bacterium]|nr:hypothetical protein [Acidimicrobiales bacterium]